MKLYTQRYFNPYFVDINGKTYQIGSIHIFGDERIIASNGRGWFGSNNNCAVLELTVDCVVKRKIDFKCKSAFIVKLSSSRSYENEYALYIPDEVVKLLSPSYEKIYSNSAIKETIKSSVHPTIIFETIHWLNHEVTEIGSEINSVGDEIHHLYSGNFSKLPSLIAQLSDLNEKLQSAKKKMESITIKDFVENLKNTK